MFIYEDSSRKFRANSHMPESFHAVISIGVLLCLFTSISTTAFGQTIWTKYENNPVLEPGTSGEWDDVLAFHHRVLFDGTTFHMWYSGFDGTTTRLGYATSPDGITWTKFASNPIMDVGSVAAWDNSHLINPVVVMDDTTFKMWYMGADDEGFGRVGYATSPDGITWTKFASNPVMDIGPLGAFDQTSAIPNSVIFDGTDYHMWYFGHNLNTGFRIGYATSTDGISWEKFASNPILELGAPGSWDSNLNAQHSVLFDGTTFHMWFEGSDGTFRIGYATSSNGTSWTKHPSNPVMDVGPAGSWDDDEVSQPSVIFDGELYHMWFTGGDGENLAIGYATAPNDMPTAISIEERNMVPTKFSLAQNYPNPFNPSTTISYTIPQLKDNPHVTLEIYNQLGQKVQTLVSERQSAGAYSIKWDGQNDSGLRISSGVYLYRLRAGDLVDAKKLLILQ